jgi:hypothetical protein
VAARPGAARAAAVPLEHPRGRPAVQLHQVTLSPSPVQPGVAVVGFGETCTPQTLPSKLGSLPEPVRQACSLRAAANGRGWSRVVISGHRRATIRDHRGRGQAQVRRFFADRNVEPVSGFEPLTVRLQGRFTCSGHCCFPGESRFPRRLATARCL